MSFVGQVLWNRREMGACWAFATTGTAATAAAAPRNPRRETLDRARFM
jgi:hypothetical protein